MKDFEGVLVGYKDQQSKMKLLTGSGKKRRMVNEEFVLVRVGRTAGGVASGANRRRLATSRKFGAVWAGPYPIAAVHPHGVYRLQLPAGVNIGATS